MRTALILFRRHDKTKLEVLGGPDIPIVEQLSAFKQLHGSHPDFGYVELWTSDAGRVRKRVLTKPEPKAQESKVHESPKPKVHKSQVKGG
jgi:hypothetical protein